MERNLAISLAPGMFSAIGFVAGFAFMALGVGFDGWSGYFRGVFSGFVLIGVVLTIIGSLFGIFTLVGKS